MKLLCECDGPACNETVEMTDEDQEWYTNHPEIILISDKCQFKPDTKIVRRGKDYTFMMDED